MVNNFPLLCWSSALFQQFSLIYTCKSLMASFRKKNLMNRGFDVIVTLGLFPALTSM